MWAANGLCPPVVVWPRKSEPDPSWETIVVLWDWVTIREIGGHAFHGPARHGRGNGGEGGVVACYTALDHTRGRGCPLVGARQAPTLARPYCPGNKARPAEAASQHLIGGARTATPGGASLAPGLHGRLSANDQAT